MQAKRRQPNHATAETATAGTASAGAAPAGIADSAPVREAGGMAADIVDSLREVAAAGHGAVRDITAASG